MLPDYRCTECGQKSSGLYKNISVEIIKISQCEHCSHVVDKYIEYDPVIVCIDAVLHKPQAYRHLLYNVEINSVWKLILIFLLCDTYVGWERTRKHETSSTQKDLLFYNALEWDVYIMFTVSVMEWLLFSSAVWVLAKLYSNCSRDESKYCSTSNSSFLWVHRVLTISSFGKLLAIPAVIWGQTQSPVYLLLTKVFIFTSNITALKVSLEPRVWFLGLIVLLSNILQYSADSLIMSRLFT